MFRNSIKLFSLFGIEIRIDYSWFIIFALFIYIFGFFYFPMILPEESALVIGIVTVITVILFFGSVLFHEMSHSLVARKKGMPVNKISLFIFGGMSHLEKEADDPGSEFIMALSGPLASFVLAGVFGGLWFVSRGFVVLEEPFRYLAIINVVLGVFNLIPGFPLDGGRVLRSIIWKVTDNLKRSTYIAMIAGRVVGFLLVGTGILFIFMGNFMGGIWFAIIGWFLQSSAYASYRQTVFEIASKGIKVKDIMKEDVVVVPKDLTLNDIINEYFMKYRYGRFPVVESTEDQRFIGMVSIHDIKSFSSQERDDVKVGDIVKTVTDKEIVSRDMEVSDAIKKMSENDLGHLVIMSGDSLQGLITKSDVMKFMKFQSEFD